MAMKDTEPLRSICILHAYALLLRSARDLCIVDPQTSKYVWSGLSAMPINSSINAVLQWMADKFGNIRYLPKLHKPRLEMRRIEADTRSPFKTVATYVAMILNRIARTYPRILLDAKELIVSLQNGLEPASDSWLVALDLKQYFDSIDIRKLQCCLASAISRAYPPATANFMDKLIDIILR